MGLRLVSKATTRLDIGDDGDYIEVRDDISRREFNSLIATLPQDGLSEEGNITFDVASNFSKALFDVFVEGWSLDVPATADNYDELSRESATLIDAAVSEHFNDLTPDSQEQTKSEEPSGA